MTRVEAAAQACHSASKRKKVVLRPGSSVYLAAMFSSLSFIYLVYILTIFFLIVYFKTLTNSYTIGILIRTYNSK